MHSLHTLVALAASAAAVALPQAPPQAPAAGSDLPLVGEGGSQSIPTTPKAPGTFSNGAPVLDAEPPDTNNDAPDIYGPRSIDIPYGRLFNGKMNFFKETNDPSSDTTTWGSEYDNANQSACGIPANAFYVSEVAINPYFLKYAGLDRYCMQDVCISIWKEDGTSDMMLKVTDICTPDSADGIGCTDPMDLKVDRAKAGILMGLNSPPTGDTYPENVWWFFAKCWDDGLVQPAYQNNSNWFAEPYLPNDLSWSQGAEWTQYCQNQESYPAKGWETYPNGSYNTTRVATPINDYDANNLPEWCPIAGGLGSSLSELPANCAGGAAPSYSVAPPPATSSASGSGSGSVPTSTSSTAAAPPSSSTTAAGAVQSSASASVSTPSSSSSAGDFLPAPQSMSTSTTSTAPAAATSTLSSSIVQAPTYSFSSMAADITTSTSPSSSTPAAAATSTPSASSSIYQAPTYSFSSWNGTIPTSTTASSSSSPITFATYTLSSAPAAAETTTSSVQPVGECGAHYN